MTAETANDRKVIRIGGADARDFLQGLITNDIAGLDDGPVYTAILTPQGKYLADFFLVAQGDDIFLDVAGGLADGLVQRLSMYRLRAAVTIEPTEIAVTRGTGTPPNGAFADPRDPALGWRAYDDTIAAEPGVDWDAVRVAAVVPESGVELVPNDSYILEMGFERLNGVDFRKGCYVGQEVTARMKHKTELRKGLAQVSVSGSAPVGTAITTAEGKPAGTLYTQSGGRGLAYLRFNVARGEMQAGDAVVRRIDS